MKTLSRARKLAAAAAWIAVAASLGAQQPGADDPVLRAMRDELQRATTLKLPNVEGPYYTEFTLDDVDGLNLSASLGGLLARTRLDSRVPGVAVRVGDVNFDNTNFPGGGFGLDGERFPLDDSYLEMRRFFWLASDAAYKGAVEAVARKRAALRNVTLAEQIPDFSKAPPVVSIGPRANSSWDEKAWTERVRELSAIFKSYPALFDSGVELELNRSTHYLVNSEGTAVREPLFVVRLQARAIAQAGDGMLVRDGMTLVSLAESELPPMEKLREQIRGVAEQVTALTKAPFADSYNGPVLFEGAAGAQVFAEVLGRNFALTRRPAGEAGRSFPIPASELEGRIGSRILPDSFEVTDDPTLDRWNGRLLFGHYGVDMEGVKAAPVKLVEKGVLKNFLLTRQPVKTYRESNGRARLPGPFGAHMAGVSNLFVKTSEGVPAAGLKTKLIELVKERGKPYGILVRKMDFPSSASLDEVRRLLGGAQAQSSGSGRPVSIPVQAYRVYPDGREELIRGVRFRGLAVRSLKDILAASSEQFLFDYLENGAPFALAGAGGYSAETAVVAPAILVDDLDLQKMEEELPRIPLVTPPPLAAAN